MLGFNVIYLFERGGLLRKAMAELLRWMEDGSIRKFPIRSFPAEDAAGAHRALESGLTTGKLVLSF